MDYLQKVRRALESWERLSSRTLDNGTKLIGHVPHVAPEAWLHQLFAPTTIGEVKDVERELKCTLPIQLADFLRNYNGINMFSTTLSIYGLRRQQSRNGDAAWQPFSIATPNVFERPKDSTASQLYVGGYNWDGSKLYIDSGTDKVFRCSRDSARPLNEWGSFGEMLLKECDRIAALFDDSGRERWPDKPTVP